MGDNRGILPLSFRGNMAENWKLWRARFENFLIASETNKKDKTTQCAQLLHYIGEDGFKIFTTFKIEDNQKNKLAPLIQKFEEHFVGKENIAYERYMFFTYRQEQGQTTENFIIELKKKASRCKLEALQDSLILTMITCGIRNILVRERLLQDKAVEFCYIIESAKARSKAMGRNSAGNVKEEVDGCSLQKSNSKGNLDGVRMGCG